MIELDIGMALIDPPQHPSRIDGIYIDFESLADSMRTNGLINRVLVKSTGERFEVVAGHRRFLAARALNWHELPCRVLQLNGEGEAAMLQIAENLEQSKLSPIEEGAELRRILELHNLNADDLPKIVHRSSAWVYQRLKLLDLPDDLAPHVHTRALAMSAALLLAHVDDAAHRRVLMQYVLDGGATTQTIANWVSSYEIQRDSGQDKPFEIPPPITPGDRVIVTLPCHCCHATTNMDELTIARLCGRCAVEMPAAYRMAIETAP